MSIFGWILISVAVAFLMLFAFSMAKIASIESRREERTMKEVKDEQS